MDCAAFTAFAIYKLSNLGIRCGAGLIGQGIANGHVFVIVNPNEPTMQCVDFWSARQNEAVKTSGTPDEFKADLKAKAIFRLDADVKSVFPEKTYKKLEVAGARVRVVGTKDYLKVPGVMEKTPPPKKAPPPPPVPQPLNWQQEMALKKAKQSSTPAPQPSSSSTPPRSPAPQPSSSSTQPAWLKKKQ